jgi:hypothetical protein
MNYQEGFEMKQYDQVDKLVHEMLGVNLPDIPDILTPAIEMIGGATPFVGSLWTGFKINRLKKRLDKVEPELRR